jgi:hypothetical protein
MNSEVCELLILEYALAIDGQEGRSTVWGAARNHLWDAGAKISDSELMTTLQGMRGASMIELRKWDDACGFVDFSEYGRDDFFHGQFLIRPTYAGKKVYERLAVKFTPTEPANNRPIGFTAG